MCWLLPDHLLFIILVPLLLFLFALPGRAVSTQSGLQLLQPLAWRFLLLLHPLPTLLLPLRFRLLCRLDTRIQCLSCAFLPSKARAADLQVASMVAMRWACMASSCTSHASWGCTPVTLFNCYHKVVSAPETCNLLKN